MKSVWLDGVDAICFDTLKGDVKTDVLVIGGGLAGLLCGYMLKNAGIDCIVVEANKICSGVTQNTTAKITSQHGFIYHRLINKFGVEKAKMYYAAQKNAMDKYKQMCLDIDCDYSECNSYVYSINDRQKAEKELYALDRIGVKAQFTQKTQLPFKVSGAVMMENQAQFHPLKFAYSVSQHIPIYENTRVTQITPDTVITENGTIRAKKVIVATHFPFINKHGGYFVKMYQHRSYVLALSCNSGITDMYVDDDKKGLSFRNYNGLLLLGGGGHRTGKKGGNFRELTEFANKYYPKYREAYRFATQDCMTLDGVAYIGTYSKNTPNVYVATGFNKWGITNSMVSATIIADMILERKNEYQRLFSPERSILHPQLGINMFETLCGLLTPTVPRCPHLGCALKYNKAEHTWDCSCHGSRFTDKGKLIDNPANGDKQL